MKWTDKEQKQFLLSILKIDFAFKRLFFLKLIEKYYLNRQFTRVCWAHWHTLQSWWIRLIFHISKLTIFIMNLSVWLYGWVVFIICIYKKLKDQRNSWLFDLANVRGKPIELKVDYNLSSKRFAYEYQMGMKNRKFLNVYICLTWIKRLVVRFDIS